MCGIVGYAGSRRAVPVLLEGLSKLEYRGYDSAGICVEGPQGLTVCKSRGRLQKLVDKLQGQNFPGCTGIGHTRWATHGAPSDVNSHPHLSQDGRIALVHNGIIENEAVLRTWLREKGLHFCSETDTEVVANLVAYFYASEQDLITAVRRALARLEGSFALGILCADLPGKLLAVKKDSPLVFGFGQNENFIASDVPAILRYTRKVTWLEDGEMAVFDDQSVTFFNSLGDVIVKTPEEITWEPEAAEKGGYAHFMLKEIMEQPKALRDTISPRIRDGRVQLEGILTDPSQLRRIYLVGCGSAYYVSVLGKYTLEKYCRIPVEAVMASEFRYSGPALSQLDLVVVISQSGETADSLAALKEAKRQGAATLAVVNVVGSAIARLADQVLYTWAGPEIAVATTKAFSTQLAVVYLLTLHLAERLESVSEDDYAQMVRSLQALPELVRQALSDGLPERCQYLANRYQGRHDAFFVGRNLDSAVCLEGSLKLKEVAYLHSEAYPAGELKHGPIAMLEAGSLVMAVNTVQPLFDKTMANLREVKARGADVVCVVTEDMAQRVSEVADHCIPVPRTHPMLQPSLSLLPLQVFAYYIALCRGCDPDKPRNLAKSVTVE